MGTEQSKILPKYLNLGCGGHFSTDPEWLNMDIAPVDTRYVHQYQLQMGIPFLDNSFEGVYHSHMLEHFPREQVVPFLRECLRVLKPGGTVRIAVPDLEPILRGYIAALDDARSGDSEAEDRLLWMQVELLDQLVRTHSGGLMAPAWQRANAQLHTFIRSRIGGELDNIPRQPQSVPLRLPEKPLALPQTNINFLNGGERHCWMYDTVSLSRLLREAGFDNVQVTDCHTEHFGSFQPDCLADGTVRKPDSCYVEGRKSDSKTADKPTVCLFSTTDRGGAGIAAMRLQQGLRQIDVPSVAYVQYKLTTQEQIYVLPPVGKDRILPDGEGGALASQGANARAQARALAQWPRRPAGCEMFSTSESCIRLGEVPGLEQADIIHLHWIATFLDIPADTRFLKGKKIVWTLHDMNPFTGGCHYADGCEGFLKQCGNCPQLGSDKEGDLSRQTWKRKDYCYRNLDITVVALSEWLADCARRSSLLGRFPVHVIPNSLPLDIYRPYPKGEIRKEIGIPVNAKTLLFSADNVLNRRKGLRFLLEALDILHSKPEADNVILLLLGSAGEEIQHLRYPVKVLGSLSSQMSIAAAYAAADAVVLPTLEDNLPNVLLEALACGTPAVAFNVGGVPDIIDHLETGYLARPRDAHDLAQGLLWAVQEQPARSRLCRARAMEKFSPELQANRYRLLYEEIVQRGEK